MITLTPLDLARRVVSTSGADVDEVRKMISGVADVIGGTQMAYGLPIGVQLSTGDTLVCQVLPRTPQGMPQ